MKSFYFILNKLKLAASCEQIMEPTLENSNPFGTHLPRWRGIQVVKQSRIEELHRFIGQRWGHSLRVGLAGICCVDCVVERFPHRTWLHLPPHVSRIDLIRIQYLCKGGLILLYMLGAERLASKRTCQNAPKGAHFDEHSNNKILMICC